MDSAYHVLYFLRRMERLPNTTMPTSSINATTINTTARKYIPVSELSMLIIWSFTVSESRLEGECFHCKQLLVRVEWTTLFYQSYKFFVFWLLWTILLHTPSIGMQKMQSADSICNTKLFEHSTVDLNGKFRILIGRSCGDLCSNMAFMWDTSFPPSYLLGGGGFGFVLLPLWLSNVCCHPCSICNVWQ